MTEKRFILTNNEGEITILDIVHELVEEEGNALLFSLDFENYDDANYVARELRGIVRILNEQYDEIIELNKKMEKKDD